MFSLCICVLYGCVAKTALPYSVFATVTEGGDYGTRVGSVGGSLRFGSDNGRGKWWWWGWGRGGGRGKVGGWGGGVVTSFGLKGRTEIRLMASFDL